MNLSNLFKSTPKVFDISSVKYKKPIDDQLVNKLIDYFQLSYKHLSKIMLGMHGEINSTVAGALLKQALGENAVAMIFDFETPKTNKLVEIGNYLKLESYILKRGSAYQNEVSSYHLHKPGDLKNFYKRFINYHLFVQAQNMGAAVVDTIDKSDRLLGSRQQGFYGHLIPFYSLYKSELYDLAVRLGIPNQFITPTNYQGLPYPGNLVLTWDKIDPVLFLLTEKQLSPEEISQQFNIDLHFLKRLKSYVNKQLFQTSVSQFII